MFVGRFFIIVPAMAIAGSLAAKKIAAGLNRHLSRPMGACSSDCSSA